MEVTTIATGLGLIAGVAAAIYKLNRHLKRDKFDDKREERIDKREERFDAVNEASIKALTGIIATLRDELARQQADTARLSQGMTNLTAQLISQSNNMMLLKNDWQRAVNVLIQVKQKQDDMIQSGALQDRLWDINTDVLRPKGNE